MKTKMTDIGPFLKPRKLIGYAVRDKGGYPPFNSLPFLRYIVRIFNIPITRIGFWLFNNSLTISPCYHIMSDMYDITGYVGRV